MTDLRGVLIRHPDLIILAEPAPRLNGWYEPRLYTYRGTGRDELTAWMDDAPTIQTTTDIPRGRAS